MGRRLLRALGTRHSGFGMRFHGVKVVEKGVEGSWTGES